jgi:RNA polymerase sigma-70 factor (ECF subfamily)
MLMRRVRQGDADAAAELVRRFEPTIQEAVRRPLIWFALRRELDPNDISQMVLARFFLENWARRRDFEHAEQLTAWLLQLARSRLRKELRRRSAVERVVSDDDRWQMLMDWVLERHS